MKFLVDECTGPAVAHWLEQQGQDWNRAMAMHISEDIRPFADLEQNASEVLEQLRATGRPIVLTIEGKADAVLMDAKTYEKHLRAANMSRLLAPAEADIAAGRVRSARSFLKEFKDARKISG